MIQREVSVRKILSFAIYFRALACQNMKGKEIIVWMTIVTAILAYFLQHLSNPCPKTASMKHSQIR